MNIRIRKIEEHDFSELLALFQEFTEFEKRPEMMVNSVKQMNSEKEHINGFVAIDKNNELIGYATCFFAYYTWIGKSLYMDDLYVKPDYRGEGIGSKLINKVIEFAKLEDCKKLKWQVSDWNHAAIEFYRNLGAKVDGAEWNCDLPLN